MVPRAALGRLLGLRLHDRDVPTSLACSPRARQIPATLIGGATDIHTMVEVPGGGGAAAVRASAVTEPSKPNAERAPRPPTGGGHPQWGLSGSQA